MRRVILALMFMGLVSSSLLAKSAEAILKENNCMECHNIRGMKSAPPFSMIYKMNKGWFGLGESSIKDSIKNGSKSKYPMFSNTYMPAYKHLSDTELETLVDWIKSQSQMGMRNNKMNHNKWW